MKKTKVLDSKIFDIDYLINCELTEDDIYRLFDTNSLLYSLIVGMFKQNQPDWSDYQIIKLVKSDPEWQDHYHWSKSQYFDYTNTVAEVFKNLYQCSKDTATSKAQWFIIRYGLVCK